MSKQRSEPTSAVRFAIWIATAKKLRTAAVAAEADYWRHLQAGERDDLMWREAGYATFDAALERLHTGAAAKYRTFLATQERFGWERVRAIGFDRAREIFRRVSPEAMSAANPETSACDAIVADVESFIERNKVPPSRTVVATLIAKHDPPPPEEKDPGAVPTEETDAEQNKRLRRDNAQLVKALAKARDKIRELTAELTHARAMLGGARVDPGQRGASGSATL